MISFMFVCLLMMLTRIMMRMIKKRLMLDFVKIAGGYESYGFSPHTHTRIDWIFVDFQTTLLACMAVLMVCYFSSF